MNFERSVYFVRHVCREPASGSDVVACWSRVTPPCPIHELGFGCVFQSQLHQPIVTK
jgi:hypothetical protein